MRIFAKQRLDYLLLLALLHLFLRRRQCQHTGAQIDPSRSLTSTLKLSNSKYFTDMSYFSIRYLFSSILDRYVSSIYFNIKWPKSIDLATSYSYNSGHGHGGHGHEIYLKTSSNSSKLLQTPPDTFQTLPNPVQTCPNPVQMRPNTSKCVKTCPNASKCI